MEQGNIRIRELNLIRFGKFTNKVLNLPIRDRDLHLVVGPNEAGKSTARHAIVDWLFGIHPRTRWGFLHGRGQLRLGGVLERRVMGEATSSVLAFDRTKKASGSISTPEGVDLADDTLGPWLGSLSRESFLRLFALDHEGLLTGGRGILSASDDLGSQLFQSAAGLAALNKVMGDLGTGADALWNSRKAAHRAYYKAYDAMTLASNEIRNSTVRAGTWRELAERIRSLDHRIETAREQARARRDRIRKIERLRQVMPYMRALDEALANRAELLAGSSPPLLPEGSHTAFHESLKAQQLEENTQEILTRTIGDLEARLAGLVIDDVLLACSSEIGALEERRIHCQGHKDDLTHALDALRLRAGQLESLSRALGWASTEETEIQARLPARSLRTRLAACLQAREPLRLALAHAETSLTHCQRDIEQATDELAQAADAVVSPELRLALQEGLQLGSHESDLEGRDAAIDDLEQKMARSLAELGPWSHPPEVLQTMLVPDRDLVQERARQRREQEHQEQATAEDLARKRAQIEKQEAELQHLVRDNQPVSRQQVLDGRKARDASWQAIREQPQTLLQRASEFEARVLEADQLADARLDRAQFEADRQARADAIQQLGLELRALETRRDEIQARLKEQDAEWQTLADRCGLPALPLDGASTWIQQREAILDLHARILQARREREKRAEGVRQVVERLWTLIHPETAPSVAPDLKACLLQAQDLVKKADEAQGRNTALAQKLQEGQRRLPELQEAELSARTAWNEWLDSWNQTLQVVGYLPDAPIPGIEADLGRMDEVDQLLDSLGQLRTRDIEPRQADLGELAEEASRLAIRVAADLVGQSPEAISTKLAYRLKCARDIEREATSLREQLAGHAARREEAQRKREVLVAELKPLLVTAGVEDLTALGRAIDLSEQRRAIERTIEAERQKVLDASDGLSVDEVRAACAGADPDDLVREKECLEREDDSLQTEIASLSGDLGAARSALEGMDDSSKVAVEEAKRQEAISEMAEAVEGYLRLKTAATLLDWSIEKFRKTHQGPMLNRASAIFRELTVGSFSGLMVDSTGDKPVLQGVRSGGQAEERVVSVEVEGMSEGTRDQLYLALRLAALGIQAEEGQSMPLIADDLFINFDDNRTMAGLEVLGELSRHTQVIFLTHHEHMVPLAKSVLGDDLPMIRL